MRTAIVILLVISLFILLLSLTYKAPINTEAVVLRDITDPHQAQPEATETIKLFNLEGENMWNGGQFTFITITDVSYGIRSKVNLPAENKWWGNEMQREKQVNKFTKEVSEIIEKSKKDSTGRPYSSVLLPISMALQELAKSGANSKFLFIYSDLMENTLDISLYSGRDYMALNYNPDSLKKTFAAIQTLPDLKGIEVKLIYLPINAIDDKRYRIVSGLLRNILESKGAMVTIGGSLDS